MEQASAWHTVAWFLRLPHLRPWREFHIPVQNAASKNQKTTGHDGSENPQKDKFGPQKTTGKPLWKVERSISVHFGGSFYTTTTTTTTPPLPPLSPLPPLPLHHHHHQARTGLCHLCCVTSWSSLAGGHGCLRRERCNAAQAASTALVVAPRAAVDSCSSGNSSSPLCATSCPEEAGVGRC